MASEHRLSTGDIIYLAVVPDCAGDAEIEDPAPSFLHSDGYADFR
jgi:hypothetical protein